MESAKIDINIDKRKRYITIYDNGTGIEKERFYTVMSSIAASEKKRDIDKGFRGIGRLGGIGTCKELRFTTSAFGENVKSICTWNAAKLQEILNDPKQNPEASALVDACTAFEKEECENDEHFFEVELIGIQDDSLLDKEAVKDYLRQVAPIPYVNTFEFADKIADFVKKNGFKIDEYQVFVGDEAITKPYKNKFYEPHNGGKKVCDELSDIAFEIFYDHENRPLAWMWYGISRFEKQIKDINMMRGVRLRQKNIEIGDESVFGYPKFFRESRGPLYFVGEVFAVHPDLVPNARRDYFNINATCREFENMLKPIFGERFLQLYTYSNKYKKALQSQSKLKELKKKYKDKISQNDFLDEKDKIEAEQEIVKQENTAEKDKKNLKKWADKAKDDDDLSTVYHSLKKQYPIPKKLPNIEKKSNSNGTGMPDDENKNKKKSQSGQFKPQSLTQLDRKERKLVGKIYRIIQDVLRPDEAADLINKIQEELSK